MYQIALTFLFYYCFKLIILKYKCSKQLPGKSLKEGVAEQLSRLKEIETKLKLEIIEKQQQQQKEGNYL